MILTSERISNVSQFYFARLDRAECKVLDSIQGDITFVLKRLFPSVDGADFIKILRIRIAPPLKYPLANSYTRNREK